MRYRSMCASGCEDRYPYRRELEEQSDAPGMNRTCARGLGNRLRITGVIPSGLTAEEFNLVRARVG